MSIATASDKPASTFPDQLWGKRDVMRFFQISRASVDAWMRSGRIPKGQRFGKFLRWDPRAIQRLAGLDDNGTGPATDPK
jgi:predicted DNA-binding transcriptional regulator AlpA